VSCLVMIRRGSLDSILASYRATNLKLWGSNSVKYSQQHAAFIDYKAIRFKEIALITGWSPWLCFQSVPLCILINVLPHTWWWTCKCRAMGVYRACLVPWCAISSLSESIW